MTIFTEEFLSELNFKTDLLLRSQSVRLKERKRYFLILGKYKAEDGQLWDLPIEKFKELVEELEGGDA